MNESKKIKKLFEQLCKNSLLKFPQNGYVEKLDVPDTQGVYIIYNSRKIPVHVGRTVRGRRGLRQRLNQHLLGQSSFTERYLDGKGRVLRNRYWFKYLEVKNDRKRALLEALGVGILCPKHLGLGNKK